MALVARDIQVIATTLDLGTGYGMYPTDGLMLIALLRIILQLMEHKEIFHKRHYHDAYCMPCLGCAYLVCIRSYGSLLDDYVKSKQLTG
jgi:hypothetical protein